MPSLIETARHTIARHGMLGPGERVVAAVSGGPDSVAMLYALRELSGELGLSLAIAHLDHGFRPESAREAEFVGNIAEGMGIPFFMEKARLKESLLADPENKQAAARRVRYKFLERVRLEFSAGRIAVGHTADDQAETWLMRLLRGSGAQGLSAIPPVRGRIIRPIIGATREQVFQYLKDNNIGYVTDPSNLRPDYLRNRLRMELLPLLKKYNPEVVRALCQSSEILREEDEFLGGYVEDALDGLLRESPDDSLVLDREVFLGLHPAVRRRVLRLAIGRIKGDLLGLGFLHVAEALELAASGNTGKSLDLPGGVRIETSYGNILVRPRREKQAYELVLPVPGRVEVPEAGVVVEAALAHAGECASGDEAAVFDPRLLKGPLIVRSRRAGDAFYPVGMEGRKKLQDFFVDRKTPRVQRDKTPILASGDDILWLIGMRKDRRYLARPETDNVLLVKANKKLHEREG